MSGIWGSRPHTGRAGSTLGNGYGWNAVDAIQGPEFTGAADLLAAGAQGLTFLPRGVAWGLLATLLLIGVVGCTAAEVQGWGVGQTIEVCRADEVTRTDCVHPATPLFAPITTPNSAGVPR